MPAPAFLFARFPRVTAGNGAAIGAASPPEHLTSIPVRHVRKIPSGTVPPDFFIDITACRNGFRS